MIAELEPKGYLVLPEAFGLNIKERGPFAQRAAS
jgi:hypothetical protein